MPHAELLTLMGERVNALQLNWLFDPPLEMGCMWVRIEDHLTPLRHVLYKKMYNCVLYIRKNKDF